LERIGLKELPLSLRGPHTGAEGTCASFQQADKVPLRPSHALRKASSCWLRERLVKILKFPNKTTLFTKNVAFVARCVTYTYILRNERQTDPPYSVRIVPAFLIRI
jgi:hypothetical protein